MTAADRIEHKHENNGCERCAMLELFYKTANRPMRVLGNRIIELERIARTYDKKLKEVKESVTLQKIKSFTDELNE